jgi:hypothetical protein
LGLPIAGCGLPIVPGQADGVIDAHGSTAGQRLPGKETGGASGRQITDGMKALQGMCVGSWFEQFRVHSWTAFGEKSNPQFAI